MVTLLSDAPVMPLPEYGSGSVADILPSVASILGVADTADPLGFGQHLGAASRVCLLLVDGMGWDSLRAHADRAPFLASLLPSARPLTATFPSTTASSLASFGTGRAPGEHGVVGYTVRIPGATPAEDRLMQSLRWDDAVDPRLWQPHTTVFEQAAADGVSVRHIGPAIHGGTGLTVAALRGATYLAADTVGDIVALASAAASDGNRSLTYAYYGDLDKTGHRRGCHSTAWAEQLSHVDLLAERLAATLPQGTLLIITADHGMIDINPEARIDLDGAAAGLRTGIALIGGEPRARHLYTRPGAAHDVQQQWQTVVGDRMWIASRAEAVEAGWFGPSVDAAVLPRIGDVLAVPFADVAVTASRVEPMESSLIGVHGACSSGERMVPLLISGARV